MTTHERDMQRLVVEPVTDALEAAGIYVAVEVRDGTVTVTGEVDSLGNKEAALDVVMAVAEPYGLVVDDAIEITGPESGEYVMAAMAAVAGEPFIEQPGGFLLSPDEESEAAEDVGTTDMQEAGEEGVPYFPPTDPVFHVERDIEKAEYDVTVLGGFAGTSMDDYGDADGGEEGELPLGDEQLLDDIRRELAEDALTTDLQIDLLVREGVVFLRGTVPSLEDAENAEAVAARVPGVAVVEEQLTIQG